MVYACHHSYVGCITRRTEVQVDQSIKCETLFKKESKKSWACGSSGRALPSKHEALSSNPVLSPKEKKWL
jgi:hypothetical protein